MHEMIGNKDKIIISIIGSFFKYIIGIIIENTFWFSCVYVNTAYSVQFHNFETNTIVMHIFNSKSMSDESQKMV